MGKESVIVEDMSYCYVCGCPYVEKHHVLYGRNHKLADKYKLILPLCAYHHRDGKGGVHFNPKMDLAFKKLAQESFEKAYPNENFTEIFGINYYL